MQGSEALEFRGKAPPRLSFGTSGLRGLVKDITDLEAYVNVRGFLDHLLRTGDVKPGSSICIAGDLRPSTERILRAVTRACSDSGLAVEHLGRIPTPALTHHAIELHRPSIMVTGSHIPFDRNGIKLNTSTGEILKRDEEPILEAVVRIRQEEYRKPAADSPFDDEGMLRVDSPLPRESDAAARRYVRRYLDFFPSRALAGMRIAVYQHSAVGRDMLVEILRGLGADVVPLGRSEQFVAVDTEDIGAEKLRTLQALADEAARSGGTVDAVVSTDGDSDRPLIAGIDPSEKVRFFGGDLLGAVAAEYLDADSICVPVSTSDAVDRHFAARGISVARTRIGSPFVIDAMRDSRGSRRVGWEANGGFLTGSRIERLGRSLEPLPTRDAVLPLLAALHAAVESDLSLVALFARLPPRFGKSGLLDDVPPEASRSLVRAISPSASGIRRVTFRRDGIEIEGHDGSSRRAPAAMVDELRAVVARLSRHFSPDRGFGRISSMDYTDGVRILFEGGDIAHVRPSGNAPQLRIYAVADTPSRAEAIVAFGIREPDGILRSLQADLGVRAGPRPSSGVDGVRRNIELTRSLIERGETPEVIGTVSGSESAGRFWQRILDRAKEDFRARAALSLVEDLPTHQAFGILLLWQRLAGHIRGDRGALVAFVFGEGTRATPLTETDNGQKPAIATYARVPSARGRRSLSMVELALRYFVPVQQYLKRSGFDGLVVKWGDEIQVPSVDLSGTDARLRGADVVRFVSVRAMNEDEAANKDWVGIDAEGRVTAFLPRRKLAEMERLADLGLLERRAGRLYGGVNLGSVALSSALLDDLLEEFRTEVNDPGARRSLRPDLDPQFFTALTVAAVTDSRERARAWDLALRSSAAIQTLDRNMPGLVERLRGVVERFERKHGRSLRMVALDFGEPYWGDIGQHPRMYDFLAALLEPGPDGRIARAIAGIEGISADARGNFIVGDSHVSPSVDVRGSVLIDARITGRGVVRDSVLIGTRVRDVEADGAFDVESTVTQLSLARRAGAYKVVSREPVSAAAGERITTLFLPGRGPLLFRVHEDTPLQDRRSTYDVPILGNPVSFREAHVEMGRLSAEDLERARREAEDRVPL